MPVYFVKDEYISYATRIHNYLIQELSKEEAEKPEKGKVKEMVLYLNQNGDLYREPKEKYCYPMEKDSNLHKIVQHFVKNKIYDYYLTHQIALDLEYNIGNLMKDIGKINQRVQGRLNLKDKIIKGRKGSGYRINPKYKIMLSNE